MWWRNGGHYMVNMDDEREQHMRLHSFTHANQDRELEWAMDTTTEEGRAEFKKEWEALAEMAPEMIKKEDLVFPHELPTALPDEPHFMRVWQHFRDHSFKAEFAAAVEKGAISAADAAACHKFMGMHSAPCVNIWIMAKTGKLDHLQNDADCQATMRVMSTLGFDAISFDDKTTMPYEQQFWQQFDTHYDLTMESMQGEMPLFIADPNDQAAMKALIAEHAK
jgi:hypothetical protein